MKFSETRRKLALEIVDAWQGDVARDTRTLSGGEGFGSLDGDTLEIALTALDSLNASGKMIGVISHVEALKGRIAKQVRVEKGVGVGHSRLMV